MFCHLISLPFTNYVSDFRHFSLQYSLRYLELTSILQCCYVFAMFPNIFRYWFVLGSVDRDRATADRLCCNDQYGRELNLNRNRENSKRAENKEMSTREKNIIWT